VSVKDQDKDLNVMREELSSIDGVDNVSAGNKEATESFVGSMKFIREVSILISILLIIVSIFIIINTIKLTINARQKEIEIMRLVGATKMYIRMPFVYEGLLIGLIGGTIGFVILIGAYYFGLNSNALLLFQGSLLPVKEVFYQLLILLPLGGMLIGGTGSYFATMKFLNK
jgi:cell division transport system permease protein